MRAATKPMMVSDGLTIRGGWPQAQSLLSSPTTYSGELHSSAARVEGVEEIFAAKKSLDRKQHSGAGQAEQTYGVQSSVALDLMAGVELVRVWRYESMASLSHDSSNTSSIDISRIRLSPFSFPTMMCSLF
jgi:hypothetical protein